MPKLQLTADAKIALLRGELKALDRESVERKLDGTIHGVVRYDAIRITSRTDGARIHLMHEGDVTAYVDIPAIPAEGSVEVSGFFGMQPVTLI